MKAFRLLGSRRQLIEHFEISGVWQITESKVPENKGSVRYKNGIKELEIFQSLPQLSNIAKNQVCFVWKVNYFSPDQNRKPMD